MTFKDIVFFVSAWNSFLFLFLLSLAFKKEAYATVLLLTEVRSHQNWTKHVRWFNLNEDTDEVNKDFNVSIKEPDILTAAKALKVTDGRLDYLYFNGN